MSLIEQLIQNAETYTVSGIAFVPMGFSIDVQAWSKESAKRIAEKLLADHDRLVRCLVNGSVDEACAFDPVVNAVTIKNAAATSTEEKI